jgi:hypothetical protein
MHNTQAVRHTVLTEDRGEDEGRQKHRAHTHTHTHTQTKNKRLQRCIKARDITRMTCATPALLCGPKKHTRERNQSENCHTLELGDRTLHWDELHVWLGLSQTVFLQVRFRNPARLPNSQACRVIANVRCNIPKSFQTCQEGISCGRHVVKEQNVLPFQLTRTLCQAKGLIPHTDTPIPSISSLLDGVLANESVAQRNAEGLLPQNK